MEQHPHEQKRSVRSLDEDDERKSKRLRHFSDDRINSLPDEILLQILNLLPINNAISTSAVSKRWISLWKSLPSLVFRDDDIRSKSFNSVVEKTLLYYDTNDNIQRFCLACSIILPSIIEDPPAWPRHTVLHSVDEHDIDSWVYIAIKLKVKELELLFNETEYFDRKSSFSHYYDLPRSLFRHKLLTRLQLRYCKFRNCPKKTQWIALKSLSIDHAIIDDEELLRKLLTACEKLECLKLSNCSGLGRIDVDCRNLKELSLGDCGSGETVRVSAPKLELLVISGPLRYSKFEVDDGDLALLDEIRILPSSDGELDSTRINVGDIIRIVHAKKLTLRIHCRKDLFPESRPHSFSSYKTLNLNVKLNDWSLTRLPSVLETCPEMETLILCLKERSSSYYHKFNAHHGSIHHGSVFFPFSLHRGSIHNVGDDVVVNAQNSDEKISWMQVNNGHYSLSRHLKLVKINLVLPSSKDVEEVVGFVQFILKQGRVLEKLSIHVHWRSSYSRDMPTTLSDLSQKILNCPRSSQTAVVQLTHSNIDPDYR